METCWVFIKDPEACRGSSKYKNTSSNNVVDVLTAQRYQICLPILVEFVLMNFLWKKEKKNRMQECSLWFVQGHDKKQNKTKKPNISRLIGVVLCSCHSVCSTVEPTHSLAPSASATVVLYFHGVTKRKKKGCGTSNTAHVGGVRRTRRRVCDSNRGNSGRLSPSSCHHNLPQVSGALKVKANSCSYGPNRSVGTSEWGGDAASQEQRILFQIAAARLPHGIFN